LIYNAFDIQNVIFFMMTKLAYGMS